MIILNEDYVIGFDSLNIILYKRINGKGGSRKFYKGSYYEPITFHSDFNSLIETVIYKKIKCTDNTFSTLQDILFAIDDLKKELLSTVKLELRKIEDLNYANKFFSNMK